MVKRNQIKSIVEAVKEVTSPTVYEQNLHITLVLQPRAEAIAALKARGLEVREHFDGPIFKDIAGYQVNGEWVAVTLKEGTSYVYPAKNINRLKHYNTKVE